MHVWQWLHFTCTINIWISLVILRFIHCTNKWLMAIVVMAWFDGACDMCFYIYTAKFQRGFFLLGNIWLVGMSDIYNSKFYRHNYMKLWALVSLWTGKTILIAEKGWICCWEDDCNEECVGGETTYCSCCKHLHTRLGSIGTTRKLSWRMASWLQFYQVLIMMPASTFTSRLI